MLLAGCVIAQILILLLTIYLLLHGDIPTFLNTIFCYIPCAFVVTIALGITVIFISMRLKQKTVKITNKSKTIWGICLVLCLSIGIITFAHPSVSSEEKQKFEETFSLQQMILYTEEENWSIHHPSRQWGKTFYIRGGTFDNSEKITAINMDSKFYEQLPSYSAIYDVVVLKNIPSFLQNEMRSKFLSEFNVELYSYLQKNSTQKNNFQYGEAEITMYYDSHAYKETERILFVAEYKQNFLMFNLIFQDTSNQLHIDMDKILETSVNYLKTAS